MAEQILAVGGLQQLLTMLNVLVLVGVVACGYLLFQVNAKLEKMLERKTGPEK